MDDVMQNAANVNNDLLEIGTRDERIKRIIAHIVREFFQKPTIPFIDIALVFNLITADFGIEKSNEYYSYLMMCLVKLKFQNENISTKKYEDLVPRIWEKIRNNDKDSFLVIIRNNAVDKLARQLSHSTDNFASFCLAEKCYSSYALFNSPPLKQHPMIESQLRNIRDNYSHLCKPLLRPKNR